MGSLQHLDAGLCSVVMFGHFHWRSLGFEIQVRRQLRALQPRKLPGEPKGGSQDGSTDAPLGRTQERRRVH